MSKSAPHTVVFHVGCPAAAARADPGRPEHLVVCGIVCTTTDLGRGGHARRCRFPGPRGPLRHVHGPGGALPSAAVPARRLATASHSDSSSDAASAYAAVLRSIDNDVEKLMESYAEIFTFADIADGIVKIRDFQTTGVVAFAKGTPLYALKPGKRDVMGQRIVVNAPYQLDCEIAMDGLVRKL
jgi:hypothetical protein